MADTDTTPETNEVPILSRLRPPAGAVRKKTRFGRGVGSGLGKTAGRGQKGQKARQPGGIHKLHFEGGQMPLHRRLPKHGFNSLFRTKLAPVNVKDLNIFDAGSTVDEAALRARGLVKGRWDGVKILGEGAIERKLTISADGFSASAKTKIEAAGGTCNVLDKTPAPVVRHKNGRPGTKKAKKKA